MRRSARNIVAATALGYALAGGTPAAAAIGVPVSGPATSIARLPFSALTAPFWIADRLVSFAFPPRPSVGLQPLVREQGRRVLEFPVADDGTGVYVQVAGRVEFERALIGFDDDSVANLEAFGARRTRGTYRLAEFGGSRRVAWVRLVLRARSHRARIGVLLGR